MNTSKTAVTLALTAALGSSGVALAVDNPFGMQVLGQGYQVAEADAKMSDGKCGAMKGEAAGGDMDKAKEGKCGDKAKAKAKDGKCGEEAKAKAKAKDGKCGEGKCGASKDKPAEDSKE
jgi:uncharacterized low-complexity protein